MFDIAIKPTPRTSTCVEAITVNPVAGTAKVRFAKNGYEYKYSNVSRAKIVNLLVNDNMSLGFWVQDLSKNAVRALSYLRGNTCLLYTSPSPRDVEESRMPSSA